MILLTALVTVSAALSIRVGRRSGKAPSRSRTPARDTSPSDERPSVADQKEKPVAAPWMVPLKKALNHGGTQRKGRDRSLARRKHIQIATVDTESGRPSVRTVVSRGFLPQRFVDGDYDSSRSKEESCCLTFITDDRSAKFTHLGRGKQQGAPIECCWWLDEAGVQFRIAGRVLVATARTADPLLRAAAYEVWHRLGESTQRQMYWPHPGAPKGEGGESAVLAEADGQLSVDGSHFVLLIVVPDRVDELHLGGGQKRVVYRREQQDGEDVCFLEGLRGATWTEMGVNP
jgi:pyridoxamine 5'-phosphate oxidase